MIELKNIFQSWSTLKYGDRDLDAYARELISVETRQGLFSLSLILIFLLCSAAILSTVLDMGSMYILTYVPLTALCLHILISSSKVHDVEVQQLLAIVLLVICSTAFVLLAHKTGKFNLPILAGIALLFIVVPLMPWGLREATAATGLIYLVFTLSTLSVKGRFDHEMLLLLQFFMISTAMITLTVIARNTCVRRKEIVSMFRLQNAHARMEKLSYQDPLTGAWNRRYLKERFPQIAEKHRKEGRHFYFILSDLNNFKELNDTYGHDYGDMILQRLSSAMMDSLGKDDILVRMGGDEFAMLIDTKPKQRILNATMSFKEKLRAESGTSASDVSVTYGLIYIAAEPQTVFKNIYKLADSALYKGKENRHNCIIEVDETSPGQYAFFELDLRMPAEMT